MRFCGSPRLPRLRLSVQIFLFFFIFSFNHTKEFHGRIAITIINYVRVCVFPPFVSSLLAMQLISYFSTIQASIICWLNKRRGNFRNTKSWNVWDLFLLRCIPHSAYRLLKELIYRDLRQKHFSLCCPFLLI